MEQQKRNEQDFWLLQYQKLWDSQPSDLSAKTATIDPQLGYQFLLNGVVHCLPFLSKIWQNKQMDLYDISEDDLVAAGINNPFDRQNILKSITQYLEQMNRCFVEEEPSAPPIKDSPVHYPTAPEASEEKSSPSHEQNLETLSECVVCMEQSVSRNKFRINDDFFVSVLHVK